MLEQSSPLIAPLHLWAPAPRPYMHRVEATAYLEQAAWYRREIARTSFPPARRQAVLCWGRAMKLAMVHRQACSPLPA